MNKGKQAGFMLGTLFMVSCLSTSVYSASGPAFHDFDWYLEDVKENGIPENAMYIEHFAELTGDWKMMIITDHGADPLDYTMMLVNARIDGTEEECEVTCDWHRIFYGETGSTIVDDSPDTVLKGEYHYDRLDVSETDFLRITDFYRIDGFVTMDYCIGEYTWRNGDTATALFTRITPDDINVEIQSEPTRESSREQSRESSREPVRESVREPAIESTIGAEIDPDLIIDDGYDSVTMSGSNRNNQNTVETDPDLIVD